MKKQYIKTSAINSLIKSSLNKAISYEEYRDQVVQYAKNRTSSNPTPSVAHTQYTILNNSRMKRLDRTLKIEDQVINKLKTYSEKVTWLVLTESWCGDAAQVLPVINKLATTAENIDLRILYRDENTELMDHFLTNESRSIPKLIAFDTNKQEVLNEWGPYPQVLSEKIKNFKDIHGSLTPKFKEEIQIWYNKNKGKSIALDLLKLID